VRLAFRLLVCHAGWVHCADDGSVACSTLAAQLDKHDFRVRQRASLTDVVEQRASLDKVGIAGKG
jgi:hypothetical protein